MDLGLDLGLGFDLGRRIPTGFGWEGSNLGVLLFRSGEVYALNAEPIRDGIERRFRLRGVHFRKEGQSGRERLCIH